LRAVDRIRLTTCSACAGNAISRSRI
jgi:hypothetical protein